LLEECAVVIRPRAEEKRLTMTLEVPANLPEMKGDRDKIKQVILNLLSNAINYNIPGGTITVQAGTLDSEMLIAVRDTGRGIRPADLAHLFDKFYRAQPTEKSAQGTGLGLAICKKIVEAHNGWIEVESQVGQGTAFTVHLPLKTN
jgi:two-component system phosphate regulon sensor histidine kinase PhoR